MSKEKPWDVHVTRDGIAHLLREDRDYGVLSHGAFYNAVLAGRVVELLNEHGAGEAPR